MGDLLEGAETICLTVYATNPSPFIQTLPNGTQELMYQGDYSRGYSFYKGVEDGIVIAALDDPYSHRVGPFVKVSWSNNDCNYIKLDGQECRSCSLCPSTKAPFKISADCRNHPLGRLVECEAVEPYFFPLTASTADSPSGAADSPSDSPSEASLEQPISGAIHPKSGIVMTSIIALTSSFLFTLGG